MNIRWLIQLATTVILLAYGTVALSQNSCGSAPLPTTPVGPSTTSSFRYGSSDTPVTVIAWRIPCSATDSMPVLTLVAPGGANPSFVCETNLTLLQAGGLQTTNFNFRPDPPTISSYCGDVVATVTVAITPASNTPAAFDLDAGFSVDHAGFGAVGHQAVSVPAYNPAAYSLTPPPGPHSVNVYIQGKNILYRNCTMTTAPIGGGTQYTASCALEEPLKFGSFEKYDY
ncbi:MAG TPA: hypothetical protein VJ724_12120 [Tahibacter sp.]|nr:hypothetical protein [Tahibacter sp.]